MNFPTPAYRILWPDGPPVEFAVVSPGLTGFTVPGGLTLAPGFHVRPASWVPEGWVMLAQGGKLRRVWVGEGEPPAEAHL